MSIVAMKRKMEAKRGLSTGGKGFSLNPKVKCGDVNSATVKSARQARQNLVKRDVCFSGSEGIQCERVWDGKRQANCMGSGDSMTQEEYIEKKRTSAASCKNVVLNFTNTTANLSTVIVEYNSEKERYEIEYDGNRYQVDWNHSDKYVGNVLSTIGNVEFETVVGGAKTQCLLQSSVINIVNDIAGGTGNKYVFNGETTYNSDLSFGVFDGNYTIMNVPSTHPIALLNTGKTNDINWNVDDSSPIIINVAGGQDIQNANGDYFTFTDANGAVINIGDATFKFMRDRTYRFVDDGITNGYGFVFNMGPGNTLDTLGWSSVTSNNNTSVSSTSAVNIINSNQYRLNGEVGTTDISFGMTNGTYKLTGIPEANPLGIVSGSGLTYSVDDNAGPIVINITGGSTSTGDDYYTFTVGGTVVNIGNGDFKFMRGRHYRFVNDTANGGITDGHQMKIYANGVESADGLGNSVPTTLDATCLDPSVDVDVTAIKSGSVNYNLSSSNVFDGEYRFTNIPQSDPIAFLNNGVAGISYRVDDSVPIYISVDTPNQTAGAGIDFYSFTLATDTVGTPGTLINIRNNNFKFMRGQVYRFIVAPGAGLAGHPFELIHNGSAVVANGLTAGNPTFISNPSEYIEIKIDENHPLDTENLPYAQADQLYYRCQFHPVGMKADLALSVLDVGGLVYNFFYGTVIVTIDSTFDGQAHVKFRDLAGVESNSSLAYSSSCQLASADGVSSIDVTIGAGHGIAAGDLYYVHQDAGVADVNMSLTSVDVGGGVIIDHFYGDIDVAVTSDFGDASVRNLDDNFIGGTNLITYDQSITSIIPGVSTLDIKFDSTVANAAALTTTGSLYYEKVKNGGSPVVNGNETYSTINTSLLYKNAHDSTSYDYYYGDLNINVGGDFGNVSVECYYHGAMGGTNLLTYTDKCDINLAGTGDANGPATLVVRSFSNTEPRIVELATDVDKPVVMSFKNPEAFIFKPVGCDALSAGSGLGGTAGADGRGYYGRGRCKVHYVNKSPQFQIKSYTGTGGYLDKLKRPNIDISFCG